MEIFSDFAKDKGKEILENILSYISDKIFDYISDKTKKIKYKELFENSMESSKKFILFFSNIIEERHEFKNDTVFKNFDKKIVNSIIEEIFEKEKIENELNILFKNELNNFHLKNNSDKLNILLICQNKALLDKFEELITKDFNAINKSDGMISFNIDLEEYFTEIKKVNLIRYKENITANQDYNCIWNLIDEDNNKKDDNNFIGELAEKNIPIINIYQKDKINKEKIISLSNSPNSINIDEKNLLTNFNNNIIDIDKTNNDGEKQIICLIKKSLFNILINNYEENCFQKSQEVSKNINEKIQIDTNSKIDNIYSLNKQNLIKIFSILLFKGKNISDFTKSKAKEIMIKYKDYLKGYEESYFSEITKLSTNEYITKIKEEINEINIKSKQKKNLSKEDIDDLELYNKINQQKIDFIRINEMNNSNKINDIKSIDSENYNATLRSKFNVYFVTKSCIFINELVILFIKDNFIKYYKLAVFKTIISLEEGQEIFLKE